MDKKSTGQVRDNTWLHHETATSRPTGLKAAERMPSLWRSTRHVRATATSAEHRGRGSGTLWEPLAFDRIEVRANSRPGARATRLCDVAPSGLGIWRATAGDLGLAPPGCTMSPLRGSRYGGRLVATWGSRHQAVRCRPFGACDMAGDCWRPGAHATRLYDVTPSGLGIWRASTERSLQCGPLLAADEQARGQDAYANDTGDHARVEASRSGQAETRSEDRDRRGGDREERHARAANK